MRLSSITLGGFKTFARPTEILFEGGVTAIVGPNGSGKSNIVDAFKWVLGESQARDLRGKRMEEVIYAGGERRPRAAAAEVTIVIDNSEGRLPVDYREVAIRRRLGRSGQSDYFLNGSRVRRRDLIDLLASTGLTVDGYAMVGQPDIEAIISRTPAERKLLIEEAARVRGVKQKRSEAADQLRELALNLQRLEDVRQEIGPRLEVVRVQAEAAREADEARRRLEILRGSIVFEEWREARDTHRRAAGQAQGLQRRLAEARATAEQAEQDFRRWRAELESAQDRRLERQRTVAALRLELSGAEHELALAKERIRSQHELAAAAAAEADDLERRLSSADALESQVSAEMDVAKGHLEAVPSDPAEPAPIAGDAALAARSAEAARREAADAASRLASLQTRTEFLAEQAERLRQQVGPAEAALAAVVETAGKTRAAATAAATALAEKRRAEAELAGLESLLPDPLPGLRRLAEVLAPEPGWETALAAALGPLLDAWVAPDEKAAVQAAAAEAGRTVLFPVATATETRGSLLEHVGCEAGFEAVAAALLGQVLVGSMVTREGVYRSAGLVRAGADPRVHLEARRRELRRLVAELEPAAGAADRLSAEATAAELRRAETESAAAGRGRLDESEGRLQAARREAEELAAVLPNLEAAAAAAAERASELGRAREAGERILAEHRAEVRRLELERLRWRERLHDLERQLGAVRSDREAAAGAREQRLRRAAEAGRQAGALESTLGGLEARVASARDSLASAADSSPAEDAELAAGARRMIELEEARVDARLKAGNLEGNLELAQREADLAAARMEEIRARMPEGLAPEEVPGGKAREREMRQLERRLEEIGPTNPLAAAELLELEDRHVTLAEQLEDIAGARADLETLIGRLREEEETRYEAVFGAVAANFQELFGELSGGGRATLRHVAGDDGPMSGVEILVQPPRKRLQNVTLLSSGERSLTAFSLVMALEAVNPSPFVILDEVDAALDDANVGRFGAMLQRLGDERQLLVITHNHATMASAAALYGIHLDESGCSHVVSVRLDDIRGRHSVGAARSA